MEGRREGGRDGATEMMPDLVNCSHAYRTLLTSQRLLCTWFHPSLQGVCTPAVCEDVHLEWACAHLCAVVKAIEGLVPSHVLPASKYNMDTFLVEDQEQGLRVGGHL